MEMLKPMNEAEPFIGTTGGDAPYPESGGGSYGNSVSVYSDCPTVLAELVRDVDDAGLLMLAKGTIDEAVAFRPLAADIIICDIQRMDAERCIALCEFDRRSAKDGQHLIISTCLDLFEWLFACFSESNPQILVAASRAERLIALGRVRSRKSLARVGELAEDERLALLRLTEQVAKIAERLDRMGKPGLGADGGAFRFESPARDFRGESGNGTSGLVRGARPSLPDPRLVRQIIQQRQLRARFFDPALFADPAWDMLLDLTAARAEHTRVSVSSLCIASGVPPTTALRWIGQMVETGLFVRTEDGVDKRRAFIALSDQAAEAMARFFAELRKTASKVV